MIDRHEAKEERNPQYVDDMKRKHGCEHEIPRFIQLKPIIRFNMFSHAIRNPTFRVRLNVDHRIAPPRREADRNGHVDNVQIKVELDHAPLNPVPRIKVLRKSLHSYY